LRALCSNISAQQAFVRLAYLARFPVNRIKLAQEFIVDLVTDPRHAAIVRAAIGLARLPGSFVVQVQIEGMDEVRSTFHMPQFSV
jgi:EAL domain-containing protein (putative c-di-GMP-specific phosphodiesterase class I)